MVDDPGWQPDPERADLERYWDGSAWTDQTRAAGEAGSSRVPAHGPQLHRALAAATADIDAVEDRLSTLFERTGGAPRAVSSAAAAAAPPSPASPAPPLSSAPPLRPSEPVADDGDEATFAELDAALVAEEPSDEPDDRAAPPARRGLFRRRG